MDIGERQFVDSICTLTRDGYRFVPLIGSGISVSSGIPTGQDIGQYLCYCIDLALSSAWDPRQGKWPPLDQSRKTDRRQKIQAVWEMVRGEWPTGKDDLMKLEGAGSLANWRASLQFLSRICRSHDGKLTLGVPDDRVVDSFFSHIMKDCHHNVAHTMLVHLADPLSIRTILTTNFDSLIEQAFSEIGRPLAVFDVYHGASLPDARLVLENKSLVKLHGGRYGLKADYSLDEMPSEDDLISFCNYLRLSPEETEQSDQSGKTVTRDCLFVLGVSGSDARTISLVKYALEQMPGLKLYWCCHSSKSEDGIKKIFGDVAGCGDRLFTAVAKDLGVFLLGLYQRLCLALPPAGADYPEMWRDPPVPNEKEKEEHKKAFASAKRALLGTIGRSIEDEGPKCPRILGISGRQGTGVMSVAAEAYYKLCDHHKCVWLDMDDFHTVEDLFVAVLDMVGRRVGLLASPPLAPRIERKVVFASLKGCVSKSQRNIVVFLNGRDLPGKNAGLSIEGGGEWAKSECDKFWAWLKALRQAHVLFVVLTRRPFCLPKAGTKEVKPWRPRAKCMDFDHEKRIRAVMRQLWPLRKRRTRISEVHYVYALTLLRHSRYLAITCSSALTEPSEPLRTDGKDNDEIASRSAANLLSKLSDTGIVRNSSGGFVCMHRDIRDGLQRKLEKRYPDLLDLRPDYHQAIADWYLNLFRSSKDPLAAIESVAHRLSCVRHASNGKGVVGKGELPIWTPLAEAVSTLRLAGPYILRSGNLWARSDLLKQVEVSLKECAEFSDKNRHPLVAELGWMWRRLKIDLLSHASDFTAALDETEKLDSDVDKETACAERSANPASGDSRGNPCEIRKLQTKYDQAVLLTELRKYDRAEKVFRGLLVRLGLAVGAGQGNLSAWFGRVNAPDRNTLRKGAIDWAVSAPQEELQFCIEILNRYMRLFMLKAQVWNLNEESKKAEGLWSKAVSISATVVELMRFAGSSATLRGRSVVFAEAVQGEQASTYTHSGVALGKLGRFSEAHRRLNEATGCLDLSVRKRDASFQEAIIDLHRAQLLLDQACPLCDENIESSRTVRQRLSLIDRACSFLEVAQERLTRCSSKSIWWWMWLYELELTICAMSARGKHCCALQNVSFEGTLRCRFRCPGRDRPRCISLLEVGQRLVAKDVFQSARMLDMYVTFMEAVCPERTEGESCNDQLLRALEDAVEHLKTVFKLRVGEEIPASSSNGNTSVLPTTDGSDAKSETSQPRPVCPPDQLVKDYAARVYRKANEWLCSRG